MGKKKKPTATKQPPKKKPSVGEAKSWDDLIESPGCSNVLGEHRAVSKIEGGGKLGTEAGPNSSTRWQWKAMGPKEAFGAVGDVGQGGFGCPGWASHPRGERRWSRRN